MKIDRPKIMNTTEPTTTEETAKEPVQLQKSPVPKTDTVELKKSSFLDSATTAKLDPSQTNIANAKGVPATSIPGVPFQEKVELPKTLPGGSSTESGVAGGDLGLGRKRTGPNHMGVDLKAGGTEIRKQLDDALKLKEGSQDTQSSAPPSGKFDHTGLVTTAKEDKTYHAGFQRPGMDKISADAEAPVASPNPAGTALNLPRIVEKVTGRAADFLDGVKAIFQPQERLKKLEDTADQDKKYVNPDADPIAPTPEDAERALNSRLGSNKTPVPPGTDETGGPIVVDSSKDVSPLRHPLVSDPAEGVPEQTIHPNLASVNLIKDIKGPDTVNPNDPELGGGGDPIVIDPNRPK